MRLPTDEELRILNEISEKEENGTLTPDEKERLVNRLKEIDEKESWPSGIVPPLSVLTTSPAQA